MKCRLCSREVPFLSESIPVCLNCLRERDVPPSILYKTHSTSRKHFNLPEKVSRGGAVRCKICANECALQEGEKGFCGVRWALKGRVSSYPPDVANLSYYFDPLPTNCVADWVCPGGTGTGFPHYAVRNGPEYGFKNLAVFFQACNFNCLFCQNWHFRKYSNTSEVVTDRELLKAALRDDVTCLCFFGGDPTPQLPFAIRVSKLILEQKGNKVLRICWETNGAMHPGLLEKIVEISLISGGCIKFDLKAWSEKVHLALTGVSGKRTKENFERVARRVPERKQPPLLIASTLLIPGYVDEKEVSGIAKFIASLDPDIPYALLAFHPQFYMSDLPPTPRALAERCYAAALEAGLRNVRIGNVHLLW